MNRRWICSDVWMDILPSFDRPQLGLKMALLSDRFDVLVDKHFDEKATELTIWRKITISKYTARPKAKLCAGWNAVDFPFPDRPLPNKIRFKDLRIDYIDHSVIAFLRSNQQIWDRMGTKLGLDVRTIEPKDNQPIWDVLASEIWPIFATNIRHLSFISGGYLEILRRRTSPTILTDLDQLNSIDSGVLFLDWIANDGPNATARQALSKWVHTARSDGQPKELRCSNFAALMEINNWYIDHSVLTFLRFNKQIWDRMGTKLELSISNDQPIWDVLASEIWPIFAPNIRHLSLFDGDELDNLLRHISPTLLTDLDQLHSIDSGGLFPGVIADDGPNATARQALSKWLHTPSKKWSTKAIVLRILYRRRKLRLGQQFQGVRHSLIIGRLIEPVKSCLNYSI